MDILIIGCGAIGSELARACERMEKVGKIFLYDVERAKAEALARGLRRCRVADDVEHTLPFVDLAIEAASQEAVAHYGPMVLESGCDLVILSVGALTDGALLGELGRLARLRHAEVRIPSGAVAGLDAIKAVRHAARRVELTTAKPPESLGVSVRERTVLFEGSAQEAVARFPKNVNVAASVSLAGIGAERTRVRVVADPALKHNTHEVVAEGEFGSLRVTIESAPSEGNPASSQLASLSAIALVRDLLGPVKVGT